MLIIEKLKNSKGLSVLQQDVVDYMLKMGQQIEKMTIKEIAENNYTSPATLIRLAKNLGYHGFEELKQDYLAELKYLQTHFQNIDANLPFGPQDNIMAIANKVGTLVKEAVDDTLMLLEHDSLQKAVRLINRKNVIHYAAISFSYIYGEDFALKMSRLSKRVELNRLPGEHLYTAALIGKDDLALIVSYNGGMPWVREMVNMYKDKNIPIIAITAYGNSYLRQHADIVLTISTREKLYSKIAGYSNEASIKLILDVLYSCYFELDYESNLARKKELSRQSEKGRSASCEILKEE